MTHLQKTGTGLVLVSRYCVMGLREQCGEPEHGGNSSECIYLYVTNVHLFWVFKLSLQSPVASVHFVALLV